MHPKMNTSYFRGTCGDSKKRDNAHAGSRARVTSMGGLYDAATLRALMQQSETRCFGVLALESHARKTYTVSEDRTHDLRIMRPTRCQLRYHRF